MHRKFEHRFYGKTFELTATQLDTAFNIAMSLILLKGRV